MSEIVDELYDAQLPFIANIYSPHQDFAIDNMNREFERIALPRNTDNSVSSQCYLDGTCDFPLTALIKLSNPALATTFPEIEDFIDEFKMASTDENEIIAFYEDIKANNGLNMNQHELWYNALAVG